MHSQLDAMMAESGLAREETNELAAVLSALVALSVEAAPTPSAELMHLFGGDGLDGTSLGERRALLRRRRGHRSSGTLAGVVVLALSGVGATGLSAAANTLPSAWQHEVADFSRHHLPFDFPEPPARSRHPSSRAPDAGGPARGDVDAPGERRGEPTQATRSATRDGSAVKGAPSWHGPGSGSSSNKPDDGTDGLPGYSMPRGPSTEHETPAPADTRSSAEGGPEQGAHGSKDGRGRSKAPDDDADGPGRDETGKKDNNLVDYSDGGDRPVKGGSVGAPKDVQKGPQKGKPARGVDQGEPGKGKPGDDTGTGAGSPGGPEESPPQQEAGDQGSTGPAIEPAGKDDPAGPAGESLSGG